MSIIELMNELNTFYHFSRLKPNKIKSERAGIGSLNGIQVVLCGMKYVNPYTKTVQKTWCSFLV